MKKARRFLMTISVALASMVLILNLTPNNIVQVKAINEDSLVVNVVEETHKLQKFELQSAPAYNEVEEQQEESKEQNSVMTGLGIAIGILIGVVLLLGLLYSSMFFLINKWINKNGKAVRAFRLGQKGDKVKLVIMPFKIVYRKDGEVFNNREEVF